MIRICVLWTKGNKIYIEDEEVIPAENLIKYQLLPSQQLWAGPAPQLLQPGQESDEYHALQSLRCAPPLTALHDNTQLPGMNN